MEKWKIFCEESGDKAIPVRPGSSQYYIVTAVLVKEEDEQALRLKIEELKNKVFKMREPLEWKKLRSSQKRDDVLLAKFLRRLENEAPEFYISTVFCNKLETDGSGMRDPKKFMNYLYGLMFKRISQFLVNTTAAAELTIDRNTDPSAQESLRKYISEVARYQTGTFPKFSKPRWKNPEDDPILGLSDFLSAICKRSLEDYNDNVNTGCKSCRKNLGIYTCQTSGFLYQRSFKYPIDWNYGKMSNWDWRGLLYHPYPNRFNYVNLFLPR